MPEELCVRAKQGTHRESIIHPSGLLYTHWMRCQPVSFKEPFLSTLLYCPLTEREREREKCECGMESCEWENVGVWGNGVREKRGRGMKQRRRVWEKGRTFISYPLLSLKCWSLDMKHCLLPFLARTLEIEAESFRRERDHKHIKTDQQTSPD